MQYYHSLRVQRTHGPFAAAEKRGHAELRGLSGKGSVIFEGKGEQRLRVAKDKVHSLCAGTQAVAVPAVRWSRLGVFNTIFAELAKSAGSGGRIMIDATHLKAHRTAASLLKKGLFPAVSGVQKAD